MILGKKKSNTLPGAIAPFRRSDTRILEVDVAPQRHTRDAPKKISYTSRGEEEIPPPPKSLKRESQRSLKQERESTRRELSRIDEFDADTRALVLPSKVGSKPQEETIRAVQTMFGRQADSILQLIEDDQSDNALVMLQRALVVTMVDLLPVVEHAVRASKGQRGIQNLNMCVSQIREMMADIQATKDRGVLGDQIADRILRPSILNVAVQLRQGLETLSASARPYMRDEDYKAWHSTQLITMMRSMSDILQLCLTDMRNSVIKATG